MDKLSITSSKLDPDKLWGWITFNMPLGKTKATPKTLYDYYKGTLRVINNSFSLVKFNFKSSDLPNSGYYTFKDGLCMSSRIFCWTLPWFGYKISIDDYTNPDTENISSVVENALILLFLNDINPLKLLVGSESCHLLYGYDDNWLRADIRYVLSACCFFYSKHMLSTSNTISIELFLYLCMINFYNRLVPGDVQMSKKALANAVYARNAKNFRSKYGKGKDKDKPVTVTMGTGSFGKKHSISMTKYGDDIMNLIYELRPNHSIRGIVTELANRGITVSKSVVGRFIKKHDTVIETRDNRQVLEPYDIEDEFIEDPEAYDEYVKSHYNMGISDDDNDEIWQRYFFGETEECSRP